MAIKAEDIPIIAKGIFKKYKIPIIVIVIAVIVIPTVVKLVGNKKEKADPEEYRVVTDIPGIEFMMNRDILNVSTAIVGIDESIDNLIDSQSYVYKNGIDTYVVFNMRNYYGIVKKGVDIDLAHSDMSDVTIDGVWFSKQDPKAKVTTKRGVSSIDVVASVSYSSSLYNDFYGTLTSIVDEDGTEYAIFFGTPNSLYSRFYPIIDYTAASLTINANNIGESREITETDIASGIVMIPDDANIPIPESAIDSQEGEGETPDIAEVETPSETEPVEEQPTPVEPKPQTPTEDPHIEEPDVTEPEVTEPEKPESEEPSAEEPVETQPEEPSETEPVESVEPEYIPTPPPVVADVNIPYESKTVYQSKYITQENADHAYSSNTYDMLKVGKAGSIQVVNDETGEVETAYVRITALYNAAETQRLVDDYASSGLAYYSTFNAPQGCHLEAVRYDVRYVTQTHSYIDLKVTGLDGYYLIFRGAMYDSRTYNIKWFGGEETNDWYTGYVAFYVVPDGCIDYSLKFGGYGEDGKTGAAWYRIEI